MSGIIIDGPQGGIGTFVFAHGAGAPMDSDFMTAVAQTMAGAGVRVIRFEFPYMAERRKTGRKRPPDKADVLVRSLLGTLAGVGEARRLVIGGKSMGGRIATMAARQAGACGVACFGYPFHPAGKPEKLRVDHLADMGAPLFIAQGERDPFGRREEVATYSLPAGTVVHWQAGGNHDLVPPKAMGPDPLTCWRAAAGAAAVFISALPWR